jgi:lysophospholipid acyltransferase (LPLAT)-like uncharacterized protein
MSSDAKYKIQLKTWDKCLIPLPFNKIVIMYAKPFKIGKSEDISENKNKCETRMKDLLNLMRRYI